MKDDCVSQWERLRVITRTVGPCGLVRMGFYKTIRPAVKQWRRIGTRLGKAQIHHAELARALRVEENALPQQVAEIRQAMRTRLPSGPSDAGPIAACLKRNAPEAVSSTLEAAERICEHIFDLLGSGPVKLGPNIDWHCDFKSGYRWDPQLFCADVPHGHLPGVDVKVPWELSRFQHLPVLAQAYLLAKDERYPREIVAQIRDWLKQNPPGYGVNWASPMEVAIRAVNWLWAIGLVADSSEISEEFLINFLAGLLSHGRYLMANLEIRTDGITTNHFLANVVGLLYLSLCLPEFSDAAKWRAFAVHALVEEMQRQVLPDGVHYESSTSYHRLVTEMFLSVAVLCRNHKIDFPSAFWNRLAMMVGFVQAYTKPNGLAPQIGDEDDGRLHVLSRYGTADPRDHRHILAVGALLFERDDWWAASGSSWHETLWYGASRNPRWSHPSRTPVQDPSSAAFPNAGLYIMRSGDKYVLFNCGPVGTQGIGTHKHNDLLAIEVHLGGEDIIVDPGSFLYSSDPQVYDSFRSTAAHSTVMVDGEEQNRFLRKKLFVLHPDASTKVLAWNTDNGRDSIVAEHNGYTRSDDPVVHRRSLTFERSTGQIQIIDDFTQPDGQSEVHELTWTFTFSPRCVVQPTMDGWTIRAGRLRLQLTAPVRDGEDERLPVTPEISDGRVSPRYGVQESAASLRWSWTGSIPLKVVYKLSCHTL